jgi:AbrB family looped-hinge helix DNA binding protein
MKTTIDHAGRLVIPKAVRDSAGLRPGAHVEVEYRDGKVQIEPIYKRVKWVRKGSFIVAKAPPGTPALTKEQVRKTIDEIRSERMKDICGK